MLILGVDCSSKQGSVAIVRDDKPLYQCVYDSNMTHSQNLLSLIENAGTNHQPALALMVSETGDRKILLLRNHHCRILTRSIASDLYINYD